MNINSKAIMLLQCLESGRYSHKELGSILQIDEKKIRTIVKSIGEILGNRKIVPEVLHETILRDREGVIGKVKKFQIMTPEERRLYIIMLAFHSETVNVSSVAKELGVARRTLNGDINILKGDLKQYNLSIESYNSKGIALEGEEIDKRKFYREIFFKLFMEGSSLPQIFEQFFSAFAEVSRNYKLDFLVEKIIKKARLSGLTYIILDLEILLYIAIERERLREGIGNSYREKKSIKKIFNYKIFEEFPFLTEYEKRYLINFCREKTMYAYGRNSGNILVNVKEFIQFINEKTGYELNLSKERMFMLCVRLELIEFKKKMGIFQFYPINMGTSRDYLGALNNLKEIFREYFGTIDTFDEMALFMNILKSFETKEKSKMMNKGEILIIYNFFSEKLIKEACKELEENMPEEIIKYGSWRIFDKLIEKSKVKKIITFEQLDIPSGNYEVIKFNFPVSKMDIANLKKF